MMQRIQYFACSARWTIYGRVCRLVLEDNGYRIKIRFPPVYLRTLKRYVDPEWNEERIPPESLRIEPAGGETSRMIVSGPMPALVELREVMTHTPVPVEWKPI